MDVEHCLRNLLSDASEHLSLSKCLCSSSFDGHDEDVGMDGLDDATSDGYTMRVNGGDTVSRDGKIVSLHIPIWLSDSTPDEFVV